MPSRAASPLRLSFTARCSCPCCCEPRRKCYWDVIPAMSRVACLRHPEAFSQQTNRDMKKAIEGAAKSLGVQLKYVDANKPDEFEDAFSEMASGNFDAMFEFPSQHSLSKEEVW